MKQNKTYLPDVEKLKLERKHYVLDANGKILGKLASQAATILRGKHKPTFTPHLDTGDSVIIINADKVKVTGKKRTDKTYGRYSGYPSGLKVLSLEVLQKKAPEKILRLAINGMLPSGRLGNQVKGRLRIYTGDQHPHKAQNPVPFEV